MIRHLANASILLLIASAANLLAADFTGRWEGSPTLPDGTKLKAVFTFAPAADGKLSGSVETSEFGTYPVTDIAVEGEKITFNVTTEGGLYRNVGILQSDGLLLEGTAPDGDIAPVLYRRVAAELAGTWRGQIDMPDGPAEIVYTFTASGDGFSGTGRSPMGEVPLKNIVLNGANVSFESEVADFVIKRRGTINGDKMNLTVSVAGNEISATFTRDPATPATTP